MSYTLRKIFSKDWNSQVWICDPSDWQTAGTFKGLQRAINAYIDYGIEAGKYDPRGYTPTYVKIDGKLGPSTAWSAIEILKDLHDPAADRLLNIAVTAQASQGQGLDGSRTIVTWVADGADGIITELNSWSGSKKDVSNAPAWLVAISPISALIYGSQALRQKGGEG